MKNFFNPIHLFYLIELNLVLIGEKTNYQDSIFIFGRGKYASIRFNRFFFD